MAAPDPSVRERVEDRLRELHRLGHLPPGSSVPIAALARRWRVSETPIREAGWRAVGEGWLVPEPRGGFRTWCPGVDELRETYEGLEILVVAMVAMMPVAKALAQAKLSPEREPPVSGLDVMRQISSATGNPALVALLDRVIDRLSPFQRAEMVLLPDVAAENTALVTALASARATIRETVRRYCRRRRTIASATLGLIDEWRRLDPALES